MSSELKDVANEIQAALSNLSERLDTLFGPGAKDTDMAVAHLRSAHAKLLNYLDQPAVEAPVASENASVPSPE